MKQIVRLIENGLSRVAYGLDSVKSFFSFDCDEDLTEGEETMEAMQEKGIPDKTIKFSTNVLDDFRKNVGKYRAETGGMIASSKDSRLIDECYFDVHSRNTSGTFYYDVESMSEVFREWKANGYETNGIYHSHPIGCIRPSYHDISTALLHLRFFELDYFYLPIFQNERRGFYTMYFYVVRQETDRLNVNLEYVLKATEDGYVYAPFNKWNRDYSIRQLDAYRDGIDRQTENVVNEEAENNRYFTKVQTLYPDHVLDKVIICIGTGGARSALENFARCGFRNYILMDADIVSPSNVATQGVFISEMGKKKVEVIRRRIQDINPDAKVVCVDRFLDDNMSDEEFKFYMDMFPGRKPTDYLILGCTDNFEAQKRSSVLALKYGTPYLAAMMYKAGAAAELIFVYPGVTESCPRCLLGSRFEKYENGFENDVDSSACTIFATERMNALKGYIALMLLMYHEAPGNVFSDMLDSVKDRNFVQIRLNPNVKDILGIGIFDRVFTGAERYTFMDETVWIPQKPDHPSNGYETCKLCGGTGHLEELYMKWPDTRNNNTRRNEV
ncbi:MAG: ThiF family adenylyltransferase [Frisingicoccus sp.]|uniref:ThiF family adenylyltransferase n=1 Tax=Frisingicoccus sp. TaxID=1918627 RepID=UPI00260760F4|nr:ThiF family adenylyltransferase [Frisingicoccus sp.]MDD6231925.1 ThiF family adenylyltransferase [Frisingicoccus sp.]